ncbi:hypothetical protein ADJ70_01805 [Olsenella sp. oral taxon 807]|uniref:ABC transporter ATP-binding protein n=1 Tax=Olsenella sp. oral taxon 807 TaxID=712411 RepID=UPI00067A0164|nr:ATP-binding cassette domain-containing protein [Olsenella sp. oral taxon 807]AKT47992.1 hypothetical protein ADJ70_01805 [Olsenella sp. oral taxon 807]
MTGASIRVSDLTLGYQLDRPVIRHLSAQLGAGLHLLSGPNGSGKSTLMLALAGQLEPIAGSVFLGGHPAASDEARGLRSVVTSRPALISSLTLRDHVELAHISLGLPREHIERRLGDYQLSAWIDAPCSELSSGNQQRSWWALSTVAPRPILLADEPFNAVDADGVGQMAADLNGWAANGRTIVMIAHDPPAGLHVSDTISLAMEAHRD